MPTKTENPISEFIGQSVQTGISLLIILPILILTFTILIAPLFGNYFKGIKIATYGSEQSPQFKHDMLVIWIFLWAACAFGWGCIFYVCQSNKGCGFQ